MKTKILLLVLLIMAVSISVQAQSAVLDRFSLELAKGTGTSFVSLDGKNTTLSTSSVDLLGRFQVNDRLGVSSGMQLLGLMGNGFNERGNYAQTRGLLRIPFLINSSKFLDAKTKLNASGGIYANRVLSDEYAYIQDFEVLQFDTWSAGVHAQVGLSYDLMKSASIGVSYSIQNDLTKAVDDVSNVQTSTSSNLFHLSLGIRL